MEVERFVISHNERYKNYCEVIILPDGDIQYAVPSHSQKLLSLYGCTLDDMINQTLIYKELLGRIPLTAQPISWMVQDLNVVSVWFDYCIASVDFTVKQVQVLKALKGAGCISSAFGVDVTNEKTLTDKTKSYTAIEMEKFFEVRKMRRLELESMLA